MESSFARCFASLRWLLRVDSCHCCKEYIIRDETNVYQNKSNRFKQLTGHFLAKEKPSVKLVRFKQPSAKLARFKKTLSKVGAFFFYEKTIIWRLATWRKGMLKFTDMVTPNISFPCFSIHVKWSTQSKAFQDHTAKLATSIHQCLTLTITGLRYQPSFARKLYVCWVRKQTTTK